MMEEKMHLEKQAIEQRLREKEKRMELMQFETQEKISIAVESKDKEIRQLQEQLSEAYQNQQQEIDSLTSQNRQLQTELQLKQSFADNTKNESKYNEEVLSGHLEKMREMLEEKSKINEDMDMQNQ